MNDQRRRNKKGGGSRRDNTTYKNSLNSVISFFETNYFFLNIILCIFICILFIITMFVLSYFSDITLNNVGGGDDKYTSQEKIEHVPTDPGFLPENQDGDIRVGSTCDPNNTSKRCDSGLECMHIDTQIIFGEIMLEPNVTYCIPKLEDEQKCSSKKGGQWLINFDRQFDNYTMVCRCTRPEFFISSRLNGDCDYVTACKNPIVDNTTSEDIRTLKCNCDAYENFVSYENGGPRCRIADFFTSTTDPKQYQQLPFLANDYISPEYLANFTYPDKRHLPDPCQFDLHTGNRLPDNVARATLGAEGVVRCKVADEFLGIYVAVSMSTDYLKNNNGITANAILKISPHVQTNFKVGYEIYIPDPNAENRIRVPTKFIQIPIIWVLPTFHPPYLGQHPLTSSTKYLRVFLIADIGYGENTNQVVNMSKTMQKLPQIYSAVAWYKGVNATWTWSISFSGFTIYHDLVKNFTEEQFVYNTRHVTYQPGSDGDILDKYSIWKKLGSTYDTGELNIYDLFRHDVQASIKHDTVFNNILGTHLMAYTNGILHLNSKSPNYTGTFLYEIIDNIPYLTPTYNDSFIDMSIAKLERANAYEFSTKYPKGYKMPTTDGLNTDNSIVMDGELYKFVPLDGETKPQWGRFLVGPVNNYSIVSNELNKVRLDHQPLGCPVYY